MSTVVAISLTADFEPEGFDPNLITWTFIAGRETEVGAGLYELRFLRTLTQEEHNEAFGRVLVKAGASVAAAERSEAGCAGKEALDEHSSSLLTTLQARNAELEEAVAEALEVIEVLAQPTWIDPRHEDDVRRLGERIGYGAMMVTASAIWRERVNGGEFTVGASRGEVEALASRLSQALRNSKPSDGSEQP